MSYPDDLFLPLPREEVIKAIDRHRPIRIPMLQARWWGEWLEEQFGKRLRELERFPEDAVFFVDRPVKLFHLEFTLED